MRIYNNKIAIHLVVWTCWTRIFIIAKIKFMMKHWLTNTHWKLIAKIVSMVRKMSCSCYVQNMPLVTIEINHFTSKITIKHDRSNDAEKVIANCCFRAKNISRYYHFEFAMLPLHGYMMLRIMHGDAISLRGFRDHSQTLVGGLMQNFDPCKEGLKKLPQIFQRKFSLHAFLWGWPVIVMAKKGAESFWGLKGGGRILHQPPPPYKCLWTVPYRK